VMRELSNIRRENSDLAFETKLRRKKGNQCRRWGIIVAERKKLRFDECSLFYDARGNRLHNRTTLGRDGRTIIPSATVFAAASRSRGRPRQLPIMMDALLRAWRNSPGKVCVTETDKTSDENPGFCDNAYKKKDSFGIQQQDSYGAGRDIAQWRESRAAISRRNIRFPLRRKAFALLKRLADCHWDNCKVTFSSPTAYRYALQALTDGQDEKRIFSCYADALFVCHGFAVDHAASTGEITFFNLSSTVTKARQLLAKDALTREERVACWYQNHPRNNARAVVSEIAPSDITRLRQQIAASLDERTIDSSTTMLNAQGR